MSRRLQSRPLPADLAVICHTSGYAQCGSDGDQRTHAHTVVIRAVNSVDAMTADWVRLPYEVLEAISSRIVSEIRILTGWSMILRQPPATIEWE